MNKEIKQRIEQLNNGKIPKGYQKTDFGVFPSDWVTDKKLIDIGTFGKGKGIPGNKMQSGGVPCVGYGDIYMKYNHFHFEEAQSFVDEETAKDSQLIKKGTLLFTGTGETAEEIGKCVCYNGDSTIYAGGDIITFVPQDVNPLFLAYQQYQNFSLKKKASFGQGHSVVHIQKESLEKLNVAYPESKNEQSRIVEILMKWDKAIELYDKQIDALTRYKAVCLRKMFPAKGQNVPKWRFQGFTGAWEQRKLSDVVGVYDGVHQTPHYTDQGIMFLSVENIATLKSEKYISVEAFERDYKVYPQKGDVLMTRIGDVGTPNVVETSEKLAFYVSLALLKPYGIDSYFLSNVIQSPLFKKGIRDRTLVTAIPQKINKDEIGKLNMLIPKSQDEQYQIGDYFRNLDHLITLHQRKKEAIINQRKILQQYLLNGIVRV